MNIAELAGAAYDAALDPGLWPPLLERISKLFAADMAIIRAIDPDGRDALMLGQGACLTQELHDEYRTSWMDKDIHLQKLFETPSMWNRPILSEAEVADPEREAQSPYVHEFLHPQDLGRIICSTAKNPKGWTTVAFHRSLSAPPVSRKTMTFGAELLPHLGRATRMTVAHMREGTLVGAASSLFANAPHAVIMLDDAGHVVWLNARAEQMLRTRVLRMGTDGRMRCSGRAEALIGALVKEAAKGGLVGGLPKATIHLEEAEPVVVRGRVIGRASWPCILFQRAAILLECAESRVSKSTAERLCDACGLTPAEAAVALALAEDRTAAEIAEQRGVSEETVKSQSQAVLRKVGVSRRAALIRIVAKLSD